MTTVETGRPRVEPMILLTAVSVMPAPRMPWTVVTHPISCWVVTLKRVAVYSTGEMTRERRQRAAPAEARS